MGSNQRGGLEWTAIIRLSMVSTNQLMTPMPFLAVSNTVYIIGGIVGVIAIAIAAYYLARSMKGKIEIELPKKGFNSGEEITGRITMTTKKSLELKRLYVALIGHEIVESRDRDGDRKTRKNEVYRNEVNILEGQTVPAGLNQAFDFTMNAPGGESSPVSETAGKVAGAVNTAAAALNVLGMTGSTTRRMEWKVEARADLPGVDIAKSQKVRVNLI